MFALKRCSPRDSHVFVNGAYFEKPAWMQQWSVIGYEVPNEKVSGGRQQVFRRYFYD